MPQSLASLREEILAEFPGFKVVSKESSTLMHVIDALLRVITFGLMRTFMTGFTTTIGETVYVSTTFSQLGEISQMATLRHERVHMRQKRQYGVFLFALLYILVFPTVFAFFRYKFEREAYAETMRFYACVHGPSCLRNEQFKKSIVENFTGAAYFWTWPFRKSVEKWYDETASKILARQSYPPC